MQLYLNRRRIFQRHKKNKQGGREIVVGLALGSGGAYGFAHIGVLRVLEENHIPMIYICGSSIGSVIASLWALGESPGKIESFMIEFAKKNEPFFGPRFLFSF
jgi:predicted acylesterase/phospholipase RssA